MNDPLLDRAQLAIEEAARLRDERHGVLTRHDAAVQALRLSVLESAMARTESRAIRDDRQ